MILITNNPAKRAAACEQLRNIALLILIAIAVAVTSAVVHEEIHKRTEKKEQTTAK